MLDGITNRASMKDLKSGMKVRVVNHLGNVLIGTVVDVLSKQFTYTTTGDDIKWCMQDAEWSVIHETLPEATPCQE